MRLIAGILMCVATAQWISSSSAVPYNPLTEIKKGVEKGIDVTKDVGKLIPTPEDIAKAGKELVLGTPIKVIVEGINQVCSLALATEGDLERSEEVIPELGEVSMKFLDMKYNRSFNVDSVKEMVKLDTFKKDKPTVVLTTGWLSMRDNTTNGAAEKILAAYRCRGDVNFILFDSGDYIATIYTWSARNTENLGIFLAKFLVELSKTIDMRNVHLIGHSLGAQISGEAGREYYNRTDKLLPRITALDPAKPCFNEGEVLNGVGRGDAEFVDVIHSNNGALGQKLPIGDADFYPNGMVVLQPGTLGISTSHSRAVEYYAESVYPGNENTFMATKCNSMFSLNKGLCNKGATPMGYAAQKEAKGNFFLKTGSESPFGTTGIDSCGGKAKNSGDNQENNQSTTSSTEKSQTTTQGSETGSSSTSVPNESTTEKSKFLGVFGR